jgi:hypothetical protein
MIQADLRVMLLVLLAGAAGLLGAGWVRAGAWSGALLVAGLAALWVVWLVLGNGRLPGALPFLATALLLAGAGALWLNEAGVVWAYLGVIGVVAAWDLGGLYGRLQTHAPHIANESGIIYGRLRQNAWLAGLSILGFVAWALLRPPFIFDRTILLVLLLLWGLAYLLRQLRAGEE